MPTLQGSTREELRVSVGYILGAIKEIESDDTGTTTTFITDDIPIATADTPNGKWLVFTNETDDGSIRQVTNMTDSDSRATLTFFPGITTAPTDTSTAELWDQWYDPVAIHNFINQAIDDATGYIFDPVEDISLHTGGALRFDIPDTFDVLYDVYLRTSTRSRQIIPAAVVWDESVDTDFTITSDVEDRLFGRNATKFVIASGVSAGDLASDNIPALDLSGFTHIEFPIKVRDTVASGDLVLRLSATANGGDIDKIITIPALTQDVDTWIRVAMTDSFNPSAATAIISVALEMNANQGDNIVWIGEIRATLNDADRWTMMPRHLWEIDKEARDLIFLQHGHPHFHGHSSGFHPGFNHSAQSDGGTDYMLMKLKGGDNPVRLTSDSTVTEVPERYIVYYAAGMALRRPIRGESTETARTRIGQANDYLTMADRFKRSFPMLKNARFVT